MQTIMFNSEKGGTGKTTLSTLTAAFLAVTGRRVLLLDFDPQAHATISFGLQKAPGLYDVLVRGVDIVDRFITPPLDSFDPRNSGRGSLYMVPGNEETYAIPSIVKEVEVLRNILDDLDDLIDICIIDTAPAAGLLLTLPWNASNYVVVPSRMEYLSLDGIAGTIQRAAKEGVHLMGIVPTMFRNQTVLHQHHYDELRAAAIQQNWPLWEPIADRIEWAEASTMRSMIYSLDGPMSKARHEAIKFGKRVNNELMRTATNAS